MAIYRLSAQVIKRSAGRSSIAAAAYRCGVQMEDPRTGLTHDYTKKVGVHAVRQLLPEGAPDWMKDPAACWASVEEVEKRKDAQTAREVQIALPRELNDEQREALAVGFAGKAFVDRGMVATVALHDFASENPHAHIMLSTRSVSPEGWGKKNRDWNDKNLLKAWREAWQEHANKALERAGQEARIDCRTLEAQRDEAEQRGDYAHALRLGRMPAKKSQNDAALARRSREVAEEKAAAWERAHAAEMKQQQEQARADRRREDQQRTASKSPRPTGRQEAEKCRKEKAAISREWHKEKRGWARLVGVWEENRAIAERADAQLDDARKERVQWQERHPLKTWLHERGWWKNGELGKLRETEARRKKRSANNHRLLKKQEKEERRYGKVHEAEVQRLGAAWKELKPRLKRAEAREKAERAERRARRATREAKQARQRSDNLMDGIHEDTTSKIPAEQAVRLIDPAALTERTRRQREAEAARARKGQDLGYGLSM